MVTRKDIEMKSFAHKALEAARDALRAAAYELNKAGAHEAAGQATRESNSADRAAAHFGMLERRGEMTPSEVASEACRILGGS